MKPSIIYLPKKGHPPQHVGTFAWQFDDGPEVQATRTAFGLIEFPNGSGEKYWTISGSTGWPDEENYSTFQIALEYQRGPIENMTFKLGNKDEKVLSMAHSFSIPAPEGFYAVQTSYPDSGEVTLSLDLQAGTVEGRFKNIYRTLRLTPKGHFRLTRDDQ